MTVWIGSCSKRFPARTQPGRVPCVVATLAPRQRRGGGQHPPDADGGSVCAAGQGVGRSQRGTGDLCKAGERKHRIAAEYLATHDVGAGVFWCWRPRLRRRCGRCNARRPRARLSTWKRGSNTSTTTRSTSWIRYGDTSRSRCRGTRPSARRSSSTATSRWPAKPRRRG
jgi:hypothetical protein